MTLIEHELKNAYIGEVLTETYTIAQFSWSSDTTKTTSIYKSWWKVSEVEIDSNIIAWSSTTYGRVTLWIRKSDASRVVLLTIWYGGSISNDWCAYKLTINLDWTNYDDKAPTSPTFWYTTAKVIISKDGISVANWTWTISKTHNWTESEKSLLETLFSQSDLQWIARTFYPTLWPTTYKVTYESA